MRIALLVLLILAAISPGVAEPIVIENDALRIEFSEASGAVTRVYNKIVDLELITDGAAAHIPWRITVADDGAQRDPAAMLSLPPRSGFAEFSHREIADESGAGVQLRWKVDADLDIEAKVELAPGMGEARFTVGVRNRSDKSAVIAIEYPVISGIGILGNSGEDDRLLTPIAGGWLFKDPKHLFVLGPDIRGIVRSNYPNGFDCWMQLMALYQESGGGFYFACHDDSDTQKWLSFYSVGEDAWFNWSFAHLSWDIHRGSSLVLDYPIALAAMREGDWREAADRYRDWAAQSKFCRAGKLADRVTKGTASKWLSEEVGFCTFGMPASFDVSAWYDAFHRIADVPVFHVMGHDWPAWSNADSDPPRRLATLFGRLGLEATPDNIALARQYAHTLTRGELDDPKALQEAAAILDIDLTDSNRIHIRALLAEFLSEVLRKARPQVWSPARFDAANMATIRRNGDHMAPFHFDFFPAGHDFKKYGIKPWKLGSRFQIMCPTDYWRKFHAQRDAGSVEDGADALYYDISASNACPFICADPNHGHGFGFGRELIHRYQMVYEESHKAAAKANGGRYVPSGTEVFIENHIPYLDFAQCRAGGGVQGDMEGEWTLGWQKSGRAERVALFTYVYHEYGPVKLDGWAKLSPEFGDLFYWIAANVALEGGLLELDYEFSSLELFPGMQGPTYQLAYHHRILTDKNPKTVDPAKPAFIREIALARTGFAKDFLCYGRMTRPLEYVEPPKEIELGWSHYNDIEGRKESGKQRVSSVVQQAWLAPDGRAGYVFVNLAPDPQTIRLKLPAGLAAATFAITTSTGTSHVTATAQTLTLPLPSRRVTIVGGVSNSDT
jgi:hypothetical protein